MSEANEIPGMVHPLSRYWHQPRDICTAPMDAGHVILTPVQLKHLAQYDISMPSGVYAGKCWLRCEPGRKLLAWYGPEIEGACPVLWREVLVVDAPSTHHP